MPETNNILSNKSTKDFSQSYRGIIWRKFGKNRIAVWSLRILYFLVFVAIFGNFIANEKPIYCKVEGKTYFPVFKQHAVALGLSEPNTYMDWQNITTYERKIMPPVPYSYNTKDYNNRYASPFGKQEVSSLQYRHWFGTDLFGRDVIAGLINGTRTALLTGIIAMGIASFIGLFFGIIAGYFHDDRLKVTRVRIVFNLIGCLLGGFYGFMARSFLVTEGSFVEIIKGIIIFLTLLLVFNLLASLVEKVPLFKKKITLPVDMLVMRLIEVMNSIPGLLILLSVVAILKEPTIFSVMMIIGLISWTGIARFVRAEFLRIRKLEYIEAAKALGFKEWRIILKHALPNAMDPVLIVIAFGIAGAVLTEATLSFLGIGMQPTIVTWGTMLHSARSEDVSLWWLTIFPGFAIFLSVSIFNIIGEGLTVAMDAKQK